MSKEALPRILPFAIFISFIEIEEIARFIKVWDIIQYNERSIYFFYPLKALSVGLTLIFLRSRYSEIKLMDILRQSHTVISIFIGLMVFCSGSIWTALLQLWENLLDSTL